jgi:hypothetical protein
MMCDWVCVAATHQVAAATHRSWLPQPRLLPDAISKLIWSTTVLLTLGVLLLLLLLQVL